MIQDKEIIQEFLIETNENLARLDEELVQLEQEAGNADLLASIFRTMHTVKGTCGFLGFTKLEHITHLAESLLSQVRNAERALTPQLVSAILQTADVIKEELAVIEASSSESEETHDSLLNLLSAVSQIGTDSIFPESTPPASGAKEIPLPPVEQETSKLDLSAAAYSSPSPGDSSIAADTEVKLQGQDNIAKSAAAEATVRLDVSFLDRLVDLVGELVLARNEIAKLSDKMGAALQASSQRLSTITSELQADIMKTRMQPIGSAWSKLPRVVRDVARTCGKQIQLEMIGADTELDRAVVEAIRDPLVHLVRNACDHGIELPAVRVENGKPAQGTLTLRAYHGSGQVHIEISDDGAGMNPAKIKRKAIEKGLIRESDAARLSDKEAVQLICLPGFSTAETVTNISGRGVGMDVVKTNIERIDGTLDFATQIGRGSTIKIKIPLTLAIISGVVVASGEERFIIPQRNLVELVRLEGSARTQAIKDIRGTQILHFRGDLLPLISLDTLLGLGTNGDQEATYIAVVQSEDQRFGLVVGAIEDTQEIVVKPLDPQLKKLMCYAGATVMGDGEVSLILDVNGLLRCAALENVGQQEIRERAAEENHSSNRESLVLCKGHDNSRLAIPLSFVDRLEKFDRSRVEMASGNIAVQYRDKILRLSSLQNLLTGGQSHTADLPESIPVIVFSNGSRIAGITVDQIEDIVSEDINIFESSSALGMKGSAVIGGRVTDVVDIVAILKLIDAQWFEEPTGRCEEIAGTHSHAPLTCL